MATYESEEEYLKNKINELVDKGVFILPKGDKGDKPIAGVDFPIPENGKDYILTENDKKDIAKKIKVPIVEKIIEKTEVVHEIPIINNNTIEKAVGDTPEIIVDKINTLPIVREHQIGLEHIRDIKEIIKEFRDNTSRKTFIAGASSSGGGSAAGPLNAVQYNTPLGTFAGSSQFTYEEDGSTNPYLTVNKAGSNLLLIDFASGEYGIGDIGNANNGNSFLIDDTSSQFVFNNNANNGRIDLVTVTTGAGPAYFNFLNDIQTGLNKIYTGTTSADTVMISPGEIKVGQPVFGNPGEGLQFLSNGGALFQGDGGYFAGQDSAGNIQWEIDNFNGYAYFAGGDVQIQADGTIEATSIVCDSLNLDGSGPTYVGNNGGSVFIQNWEIDGDFITNVGGLITANSLDIGENIVIGGVVQKRVIGVANATSITPNSSTTDICTQANTQVAGTLTINAPTGSPLEGQALVIRIKSTNIQTFAWNAAYRNASGGSLPSNTTGGGFTNYYSFIHSTDGNKWDFTGSN